MQHLFEQFDFKPFWQISNLGKTSEKSKYNHKYYSGFDTASIDSYGIYLYSIWF